MNAAEPNRLDRVEAILADLATSQQQFQQELEAERQQRQQQVEAERQQRLEFRSDYEASIADLVSQTTEMRLELSTLAANVNAYIAQSTSFLAAEQPDRAQFRSAMLGLQTETRNILLELANMRRRSSNGSDGE
ncbi:hypothetical protein H6F67_22245 [Microcoleus sp. FACHB-1515]|uniref:hypothetical protein n=1 Tax=Cyanophyceae TaxID=3028117 RepID=UPI0016886E6A|nr:hypothetical protein [Microcoleus sp. FACHB-1515]MBD2092573.1 hypothetical protein [Microcoleus sp. FACHB-1515]